jgi:polysaccharide biosynthesis protein PslG
MRSLGTRTFLIAAVAAFACLITAVPALARGPATGRFGVNSATSPADPPMPSEFQQMHRGGVDMFRLLFYWKSMEPANGSYNWEQPDAAVGNAATHRVRTAPFIAGTPPWVTGCTAEQIVCDAMAPVKTHAQRAAWRTLLQHLVARYGPHGRFWRLRPDLPYRPIRTWQIWNEPNLPRFYYPKPSISGYRTLLRISSRTIHRMDPGAKIVLAGISPDRRHRGLSPANFVSRLYNAGGARWFDIATIHPYSLAFAGVEKRMTQIRQIMVQNDDAKTPVWVTEIGWSSQPPRRGAAHNVGLAGQADLIRKSFHLFVQNYRRWNLQHVFYFAWSDVPYGDTSAWQLNAGLVYADDTPKPAWGAFTKMMRRYG